MTAVSVSSLPVRKYDRTSILLHWLIALLLVGNGVFAMMIDNWPKDQRPPIINLHAVFGVLVLLLTFWRIANRFKSPAPPLPPAPAWVEKAAKASHGLLMLGTLLIPISGAPALFTRGMGLNLGIFQIGPFMARQEKSIVGPITEVHEWLFWATMAVAGAHVVAALWHQLSLRDRLMERMKF